MSMVDPQGKDGLDRLEQFVDAWLEDQLGTNEGVASVERDAAGERHWFVRLAGEEKDFTTVRFELGQRTLYYETYVMPWPAENEAEFFAHLLRRNHKLYGAKFSIGEEDGIFLEGHLPVASIEVEGELDRVLGSMYAWVEQFFRPALHIGFASKFI